ncbi:universal stress protein [Pseudaminobacter sp. NGMCC 1.201702]|uniref:universal stress protein n=1 Tax=Pseudaminobacter sp. NGMCC 1.201702 TaxID=3391825 RepID=UPI0039EE2D7D
MYKHVLIATDGSELAQKGVDQGLALAAKLGSKATVLSVTEPLQPAAAQAAVEGGIHDPVARYDQQIDDAMKERYQSIEQAASRHGATVELIHDVDEFPAEAIVRVARLKGCDLIVMSSHGRRGIQRMLLGSQTAEVLASTTLPVLVIR